MIKNIQDGIRRDPLGYMLGAFLISLFVREPNFSTWKVEHDLTGEDEPVM